MGLVLGLGFLVVVALECGWRKGLLPRLSGGWVGFWS